MAGRKRSCIESLGFSSRSYKGILVGTSGKHKATWGFLAARRWELGTGAAGFPRLFALKGLSEQNAGAQFSAEEEICAALAARSLGP